MLYTVKQVRSFKHKSLEKIIEENHIGYNNKADYKTIVNNRNLSTNDIKFIKSILDSSEHQGGYDSFPDRGGIDICLYLLEEVIKLRNIKC